MGCDMGAAGAAETLSELCAELATLYAALESAILPAEADSRSNHIRPSLLWCTTHTASHRRDQWTPQCSAGSDPRRATHLAAAALTPTGRDGACGRTVPGSRPPLDLDVLVASEAMGNALVGLAGELRHAHGHETVDQTAAAALEALPGLVYALPGGDVLARRAPVVLDALRRRARAVLGLTDRVIQLATACPTTYEQLVTVETAEGTVAGDPGCWTLDLTATAAAGDERWRRSTLVLPLGDAQPVARCYACGYRADPRDAPELADAVMDHLAALGVEPTRGA